MSSINLDMVERYKDLVETATDDLEARLKSVDDRLRSLRAQSEVPGEDTDDFRRIEEERLSTRECLEICSTLENRITILQTTATTGNDSPLSIDTDTLSLGSAKECLREKGFIAWDAQMIGDEISKLEQKKFPFWTEDGLKFCQQYVLYDTVSRFATPRVKCLTDLQKIRSILKGEFKERCILVHWLRYTAKPGRIICFRGGGPKARGPRLMVHLLAKGSQMVYYSSSHLVELPVDETEYLFFETPKSSIDQAGLVGTEYNSKDGGL